MVESGSCGLPASGKNHPPLYLSFSSCLLDPTWSRVTPTLKAHGLQGTICMSKEGLMAEPYDLTKLAADVTEIVQCD
jgi:hypothetical protein